MAGNSNSGRRPNEQHFGDMLRLEINAAGTDKPRLRRIVKSLLAAAEAGQPWAVQMVAERLDGKALQPIETNAVIEHKFVKTPEKAKDDDWKQFLAHKAAVPKANGNSTSNTGNGSAH